jgi:hypothetical protein
VVTARRAAQLQKNRTAEQAAAQIDQDSAPQFPAFLTVADQCHLRDGYSAGLIGRKVRHLPTGAEFVVASAGWSEDDDDCESLLITQLPYLEPMEASAAIIAATDSLLGKGTPAYDRRRRAPRLRMACWHVARALMACVTTDFIPASECVLLESWPVVEVEDDDVDE